MTLYPSGKFFAVTTTGCRLFGQSARRRLGGSTQLERPGLVPQPCLVDTLGASAVYTNSEQNAHYGNLTSESHPAVDCLFGYTGRPFHANTGLQNNLNRWYDPSSGRWISEDPIGYRAGDSNLYRYVGNRPTEAVDPSGYSLVFWAPGGPDDPLWPGNPYRPLPPSPAVPQPNGTGPGGGGTIDWLTPPSGPGLDFDRCLQTTGHQFKIPESKAHFHTQYWDFWFGVAPPGVGVGVQGPGQGQPGPPPPYGPYDPTKPPLPGGPKM